MEAMTIVFRNSHGYCTLEILLLANGKRERNRHRLAHYDTVRVVIQRHCVAFIAYSQGNFTRVFDFGFELHLNISVGVSTKVARRNHCRRRKDCHFPFQNDIGTRCRELVEKHLVATDAQACACRNIRELHLCPSVGAECRNCHLILVALSHRAVGGNCAGVE